MVPRCFSAKKLLWGDLLFDSSRYRLKNLLRKVSDASGESYLNAFQNYVLNVDSFFANKTACRHYIKNLHPGMSWFRCVPQLKNSAVGRAKIFVNKCCFDSRITIGILKLRFCKLFLNKASASLIPAISWNSSKINKIGILEV